MNIKINFDDIIFQLQRKGGISKYWTEVTSQICANDLFQIKRTKGSKISRYLPVPTNADIFHSSYYRIPITKNTKNVVTIHDFIYEFGFIKSLNSKINIWQLKLAINGADAIVCVSENTKHDLFSIYPEFKKHPNIYVVSNGVSFKIDETLNEQPPAKLLKLSRTMLKQYLLFVGKRIKYKNFEAALLGFSESSLPKLGFYLLCVGSEFSEAENQLISSLGLKDNVVVVENVTDSELNYLYQNAFALIYPSLYEGFGLPPLEAMSCGCPVIASNTSSIPEVVSNAGILINPHDTKEITSAMEQLLSDETRNSYISKGFARAKLFSWEKTAQKYIEIYKSLVANS